MSGESSWSLGVLIGLPIWSLLTLAVLVIGFLFLRAWRQSGDSELAVFGWIITAVGLLSAIGMAAGFYPYSAEYHQWQVRTGTVDQIDKRIYSSDGTIGERFVVDLDGRQFACDDTRCAGVREGDRLTVTCKREWQYTGIDGYGCKFISNEKRGTR